MPWRQACAMTPLRPVGEAALMTMASTRDEIRSSICCVCFETSLPELNQEHLTSDLYGGIWHAALNSFSISTRQVLPMYELLSAMLYGAPCRSTRKGGDAEAWLADCGT